MNTELSPEQAEARKPDVIIAAIGSVAVKPEIPGVEADHVLSAEDAYLCAENLTGKTVILGGGLVGLEVGLYLKKRGKEVLVIATGTKGLREEPT